MCKYQHSLEYFLQDGRNVCKYKAAPILKLGYHDNYPAPVSDMVHLSQSSYPVCSSRHPNNSLNPGIDKKLYLCSGQQFHQGSTRLPRVYTGESRVRIQDREFPCKTSSSIFTFFNKITAHCHDRLTCKGVLEYRIHTYLYIRTYIRSTLTSHRSQTDTIIT